jgi:hypothetical protein
MEHGYDPTKHVLDFAALAVTIGTFFKFLPTLAAILSIIWTLIRIYESKTFQNMIKWLKSYA